jgi:hypothetical protein
MGDIMVRQPPEQMNTIPGMARMMIGVAANVGRKAVLNPLLTGNEAEQTLQALRMTIDAYEGIIRLGQNGSAAYIAKTTLTEAEASDYTSARHSLRMLAAVHGPRDAAQ